MSPEPAPADRAHDLVERFFAILHECRAAARALEPGPEREESATAQAERLLYFGLVGALEDGLVRTAEDVLNVLKRASQPLRPMGEAWLKAQERRLEGGR